MTLVRRYSQHGPKGLRNGRRTRANVGRKPLLISSPAIEVRLQIQLAHIVAVTATSLMILNKLPSAVATAVILLFSSEAIF
ncbi:MAG: hypothetical protein ACFCA4_11240 [Cyanophyceae cyanobacterium]